MDRRTFLGLSAAVLVLAGCTDDPGEPVAPTRAPDPQDPDATVRAGVAASEVALIQAYRLLIAREPERGVELGRLLAHHEEHLARVAPGAPVPSVATRAQVPTEPGPASAGAVDQPSAVEQSAPSASPSGLASGAAAAGLADLLRAEQQAVDQRSSAADAALDPGLVRDLCRIAASEAQHVAVLTDALSGDES